MSSVNKRNLIIFKIFIACYFIALLFMVYILPSNILEIYPGLGKVVAWGGKIFPSVNNFGERSAFPQVAQLIFMLEIMALPLIAALEFKQSRPINEPTISAMVGGVLVIFSAVVMYFVWLPGDGIGAGFASQASRGMVNSKLTFFILTTIFSYAMAAIFGAIVKSIVQNYFNYQK